MIRRATEADFLRILTIAVSSYREFDIENAYLWGVKSLENPDIAIWVGDHTFGVSGVSAPFYAPAKRRGVMLFLASEPRAGYEPCKMLRTMIEWCLNERGATSFHLGEDTGVNLAPLAKRVGATKDRDSYTLKL